MKRIFRKSAAVLLSALMLILGMMPCASAFQVPTAAEIVDRTDLTPEDYYGTWNMTYMMLEGNMVPVEILGLTSSIVIQDEMITFTDTFGQVKQYDTFFEDGHLQYVRDNVQLKICISEGGLLHVELNVLTGDLGDENAPTTEKQAKHMDANKLDEGILNEYYEKVQE